MISLQCEDAVEGDASDPGGRPHTLPPPLSQFHATSVVLGPVTWCTLRVSFSFFVRNSDQIVRVRFTNDLQSQTG